MTAAQARRLLLALPGVTEQPHHHLASFRRAGRMLATMTPDGAELRLFLKDDAARDVWLAREPEAITPLFWAGKRVGLGVGLAAAKLAWVRELVQAVANESQRS